MAETYCGKNCAECTYREGMNCPGCKVGPGKQYGCDCDLAKCCRDKGHETCGTCGLRGTCAIYYNRDRKPEYRQKRTESQNRLAAAIAQRAPLLGKWLWVLFWLFIPSNIASLMTNENIAGLIPGIYQIGGFLSAACTVAYGVILIQLTSVEVRYRTAGICYLVGGVVQILAACISAGVQIPAVVTLLALPSGIVALVAMYQEFTAHSQVLLGVDHDLSEKWTTLWKWNIGVYAALIGIVVLSLLIPILGVLLLIAAAIAMIVVSILKLVYLYRTACIFRNHAAV